MNYISMMIKHWICVYSLYMSVVSCIGLVCAFILKTFKHNNGKQIWNISDVYISDV